MTERLKILNIWVDTVNRKQAIERVDQLLDGDKPSTIFAVNPEKNFSIVKDRLSFEVIRQADLLIPDGVGIVMAAKFLYGVALKRIPGVEFMHDICKLSEKKKKPIFLYGSREAVNRAATAALRLKYPQLRIAGRSHGYVTESEMPSLVQRINHSGAEVLFLALGSPQQERWFASHAPDLKNVKLCQGIGGTLDTIAGNVRRAPTLWQKWSIEWLYRLLAEPKRLKRQKVLPVFVFKVILTKLQSLAGMSQ